MTSPIGMSRIDMTDHFDKTAVEERNLIAEPSAREQLGIMRRELNRLLATAK